MGRHNSSSLIFFSFRSIFMPHERDRIARWLLRNYLCGVTDEDLLAALPLSFKLRHPRGGRSVSRCPNGPANYWNSCPTICSSGFFPVSKTVNSGQQI